MSAQSDLQTQTDVNFRVRKEDGTPFCRYYYGYDSCTSSDTRFRTCPVISKEELSGTEAYMCDTYEDAHSQNNPRS